MGSTRRCEGMEDKLVEYLDGRAKPAQRRAVEEHLAGCEGCSVRAQEFRALWSVLDDVPAISPTPGFDAALRARLVAEPVRRGFWEWMPAPRFAFAALALVAMSVWVASVPRVTPNQSAKIQTAVSDADFSMIRDLPVLENYDVISKFDALSELPVSQDPARAKAESR